MVIMSDDVAVKNQDFFRKYPSLTMPLLLFSYNRKAKICNWEQLYWEFLKMQSEVKWSDIRPSMVTHTRNLCSAFDPSKVHTHSSEHTHTHTLWTHTRSSGQPFMLRRPGSSWGFGALLKGTSVVVLKVESTFTPPTYNSCRPETRTCNLPITSPTL